MQLQLKFYKRYYLILGHYEEDDKDMIVMHHKFGYEINGEKRQIESSYGCKRRKSNLYSYGKNCRITRCNCYFENLNKEITTPGVQLPISKEVYVPILKELEEYGIKFSEKKVPYLGYNPENVIG